MIQPQNYLFVYDHLMLVLIFFTLLIYANNKVVSFNRLAAICVPIFLIFYFGTRPISGVFVDMTTYATGFEQTTVTGESGYTDWLFSLLVIGLSKITSVEIFFFLCAVIYILPISIGLKKHHGDYAFPILLVTITSFSFFSYGVNGIRNGLGTSIFIAAIAWSDKKIIFCALVIFATGMHNSLVIPAFFYCLTFFKPKPAIYFLFWAAALIFTVAFSGLGSDFILNLLVQAEDVRVGYLGSVGDDRGGFRLDFVCYSILPVIVSYLFSKPDIKSDLFYRRLLCAYLATNAFWIIVMNAAFSNRFAYLSWFIMPWLVVYPFIPNRDLGHQGTVQKLDLQKFSTMLVGLFLLTYVFDIFIYPNR